MRKPAHRKLIAVMVVMLMISAFWPAATAGASVDLEVLTRPNVKAGTVASLGMVSVKFDSNQLKKGDTVIISLPEDFEFRNHFKQTQKMKDGFSEWMMNEGWYIKSADTQYAYVPKMNADGSVVTNVYGKPVKSGLAIPINNMINYLAVPQKTNNGVDSGAWLPKGDWIPSITPSGLALNWVNTVDYDPDDNVPILITQLNERQIMLEVKDNPLPGKEITAIAHPGAVWIKPGFKGPIMVKFEAPSGSGFMSGSEMVAMVPNDTVKVDVESVPTFSSSGGNIGVIDLKEDIGGLLINSGSIAAIDSNNRKYVSSEGNYALKLTLPPGFKWQQDPTVEFMYGDQNLFNALNNGFTKGYDSNGNPITGKTWQYSNDNRELDISVPAVNIDSKGNISGSSKETLLKLRGSITVDESVAKTGDVTMTISGAANTTPDSVVVAKYGDFAGKVSAMEKLDVTAGKSDQKLGKISIKETLAGSLTVDRTISLTLPDGAKWTNYPVVDADSSKAQNQVGWVDNQWKTEGSDMKTIKLTINRNDAAGQQNANLDPAELVFKDAKIVTGPDFKPGDLKVTVGGSMGFTGDLLLANVLPVVTAKTDATPDVKIGLPDQAAGSLTIVEAAAGAIDSNKNWTYRAADASGNYTENKLSATSDSTQTRMEVLAPPGVRFTATPTVAVTDGDLQIDQSGVKLDGNDTTLMIPIKGQSTKASTVKVSNIKVTVDRTVPEGSLELKVRGNAVNESLDQSGNDTWLPGALNAANVAVANCITPAPGTTKATAVFKIGDTKFTMNGVEQTMDAAPYLKNDRTYLPLRFVAKAVGVADGSIMWNADDQSVVLSKDNRVVKLTIGSTTMMLNGVASTMDVAPEIADPGRTMLPVRWVAQALGANIQWDNATQTVTVN